MYIVAVLLGATAILKIILENHLAVLRKRKNTATTVVAVAVVAKVSIIAAAVGKHLADAVATQYLWITVAAVVAV